MPQSLSNYPTYRALVVLLRAILAVTVLRCAPASPAQPVVLPPKAEMPGLAFAPFQPQQREVFNAVIALQSPAFSPDGSVACVPPLDDVTLVRLQRAYAHALQAGFQSVLLAHGFTLTGPFSSREQMTYGEKEKATLILATRITFECSCRNTSESVFSSGREDAGTVRAEHSVLVPVGGGILPVTPKLRLTRNRIIVKVSGDVSLNARIEVDLFEPLTGEKMWLKILQPAARTELYDYYEERSSFEVRWPLAYRGPYGKETTEVLAGSDGRPSSLTKVLAAAGLDQIRQFETYFAPAEIAEVIKDALRVRQLKRY